MYGYSNKSNVLIRKTETVTETEKFIKTETTIEKYITAETEIFA